MDKSEEPNVEIEQDEPEEIEDGPPQQVVIDLEKKPEPKVPEPKVVVQPKESDEVVKLRNTVAYQTRQLDKALRTIQEIQADRAASRPQAVEKPENLDEIDKIAQTDWKKGVKTLVEPEIEKRVNEALKKRDEAQAELTRRSSLNAELEKSKQKVISKYPSIEDDSTEEASLYRQVLNEDVSLYSNVHGPEIAMYRMEERMRQMGKTPPSLKPMVDKEAQRLARVGASSVIGRTQNSNGKIPLTREQKEFCDRYNIPHDRYQKNLKATANGGTA